MPSESPESPSPISVNANRRRAAALLLVANAVASFSTVDLAFIRACDSDRALGVVSLTVPIALALRTRSFVSWRSQPRWWSRPAFAMGSSSRTCRSRRSGLRSRSRAYRNHVSHRNIVRVDVGRPRNIRSGQPPTSAWGYLPNSTVGVETIPFCRQMQWSRTPSQALAPHHEGLRGDAPASHPPDSKKDPGFVVRTSGLESARHRRGFGLSRRARAFHPPPSRACSRGDGAPDRCGVRAPRRRSPAGLLGGGAGFGAACLLFRRTSNSIGLVPGRTLHPRPRLAVGPRRTVAAVFLLSARAGSIARRPDREGIRLRLESGLIPPPCHVGPPSRARRHARNLQICKNRRSAFSRSGP